MILLYYLFARETDELEMKRVWNGVELISKEGRDVFALL